VWVGGCESTPLQLHTREMLAAGKRGGMCVGGWVDVGGCRILMLKLILKWTEAV